MNLDDLRAAQVAERGTDSLQPLAPTFYAQAAAYLTDLRDRRDRLADRVDDPFSSAEVRQLTDELETSAEVVEAVYDRRVGKLVKQASLTAAGLPADDDGLTEEEQALFADLVDRIETNRSEVLDTMDAVDRGGSSDPAVDDGAEESPPTAEVSPAPEEPTSEPGDETELVETTEVASDADQQPEPDGGAPSSDPPVMPEEAADLDRLTVRITASVGEIYGVDDRVYTLDTEDVVTLPSPNAKPLLERGAAQRLD